LKPSYSLTGTCLPSISATNSHHVRNTASVVDQALVLLLTISSWTWARILRKGTTVQWIEQVSFLSLRHSFLQDADTGVESAHRSNTEVHKAARASFNTHIQTVDLTQQGHAELSQSAFSDNSSLSMSAPSTAFLLPSSYQPSRTTLFQQHFVASFVSSYAASEARGPRHNYWMRQLPNLVSSPKETALNSSISAVSMAFYGRLAHDRAIEVEGYKYYSMCLQSQQKKLLQDAIRTQPVVPSAADICVSLLMSYYESVARTSISGCSEHLCGAAKMLEMRGPGRCQTEFARQIFRSISLAMV
jgi:hypothetical protein